MTTPPTPNGDKPEEEGTGGPTPATPNGDPGGSDDERMGGGAPGQE